MLRRPKPTDSESDLLQEQELFLGSGSTPAASVTRRADKRRGDNASADSDESRANLRDVVTIEGELCSLANYYKNAYPVAFFFLLGFFTFVLCLSPGEKRKT